MAADEARGLRAAAGEGAEGTDLVLFVGLAFELPVRGGGLFVPGLFLRRRFAGLFGFGLFAEKLADFLRLLGVELFDGGQEILNLVMDLFAGLFDLRVLSEQLADGLRLVGVHLFDGRDQGFDFVMDFLSRLGYGLVFFLLQVLVAGGGIALFHFLHFLFSLIADRRVGGNGDQAGLVYKEFLGDQIPLPVSIFPSGFVDYIADRTVGADTGFDVLYDLPGLVRRRKLHGGPDLLPVRPCLHYHPDLLLRVMVEKEGHGPAVQPAPVERGDRQDFHVFPLFVLAPIRGLGEYGEL